MVYLSTPFALAKSAITLIQMAVACVNCKNIDIVERKQLGIRSKLD